MASACLVRSSISGREVLLAHVFTCIVWVTAFGCLLLPSAADAWGHAGHRIICEIAWLEMSSPVRREIRRILATESPRTRFTDACVWADQVRGDERYDHLKPQHYVNVPRSSRRFDIARSSCMTQGCVVDAVRTYADQLDAGVSNPEARAKALKLFAHFVADVHQPLHVAYADDRGGNDVWVRFSDAQALPARWSDQPTNLHRLWDSLLVDYLSSDWRSYAQALQKDVSPAERRQWASFEPEAWAQESYELTRTVVYALGPDQRIDRQYLERNSRVVKAQLRKAGVRLAQQLIERLDPVRQGPTQPPAATCWH